MQIDQEMPKSDYPILGAEIARASKSFYQTLLRSKPATMTQSAQNTMPPNCHRALGLSHSKIKWGAISIKYGY